MNVLLSDSDFDSYTETSDSEDQDDSESTYGGHAQSILSNLDESIGKIDDFLAYERGFVHGDIVCSVTDPSGQLGRVVDIDMIVDLETTYGEVVKNVNSKKLQKLRSFASGDYVVHGPWLGMVGKIYDLVTVIFDDGARCEIMVGDSESLIPVSSTLLEDAPFPNYPGQRVRIKLPTISKSIRWLCGSSKASHDEGTVCHVGVGLAHVNWIASVMIGWGVIPSTPPDLQDPKNLTLLSCFPHANWQLGDWCTLPSEYFHKLESTTEKSASSSLVPKGLTKMQKKFGLNDQYCKELYAIAKMKTKVNVLWQNGSQSVGLDSQTLISVDNVGDHDFWPEQFVLEKVISVDVHAPTSQRLGVVKNVDAQERTVKVKWMVPDETDDEIVSAYELIEHPDFSYCIGDIVFRLPHFENLETNILGVQANGQSLRHNLPCKGIFNTSLLLAKDTLGKKNIDESYAEEVTGYLSRIGNVIGFKDEAIEVRWASGHISMVQPSEIFGLDRLDDPASVAAANEETIPENVNKEMADQEKQSCAKKEKVIDDSAEDCKNNMWGTSALPFPWAAIGFLTNVATSLFGCHSSTSLSGFWKGESELRILKAEEAHMDADDLQPDSLKQQVEEAKLNEQPTFSLGKENPGIYKQFDTVDDYSDHHFMNNISKGVVLSQVKRGWLKKVQREWSILKKDLPDNIYVRVYEERIDILRACVVGSPGTPYHDGLFFFDIFLPPDYPKEPPLVHYISGGLRLNPNLYESGKVCLSLLNTWMGTSTELWNPESSTVLQVLLSLQALVLNDKPYFNEAGYDQQIGRAEGEKNSVTYNENAFLLSCKSMLYLLRKPPMHFEALVEEHFTHRSHHILLACKAYMEGARIGCASGHGKVAGECYKGCSAGFKIMLAKLFPMIVSGFIERGIDCSQFLDQTGRVPDTGEVS